MRIGQKAWGLLVAALLVLPHAEGGDASAVESIPAADVKGTAQNARIEGFEYAPMELQIKKGETVVWTNRDAFRHDVMILAQDSPAEQDLKSNLIGLGERIAVRFHTPGTYTYICSVHPFMQATIVVEDDAASKRAHQRIGASP